MTDSENVVLVRRALELWMAGERDALRAIAQPDFRMDLTDRVLNPDTYEGMGGIDRFDSEFREAWERLEMEPVEWCERDDMVVVLLRSRLVGRHSGIPVESDVAHVWTVREGKVASMRLFRDPEAALRFAGL